MSLPPCRALIADPAWMFRDALTMSAVERGAATQYGVMTVDEICRLILPPIDEVNGCHLFLWRVSAMVEEAYRVVRAWGFVPKTEVVWRKLTPRGKRFFGMGRHVRGEHETCIIATRVGSGGLQPKVKDRSVRSVIDADSCDVYDEPDIFEAICHGHSIKPDEFYELVERLVNGPYTELFARRERPGWACVGNQVPNNPMQMLVRPA